MSENKNAKTPADGPAANRAMTLEEVQQWITTTWIRCQDEVWRQLPTKHMSREAMSTKPEALRLADALDAEFVQGRISNHNGRKAAVELRRLHEALETEQEPVAWISDSPTKGNGKQLHWTKAEAWRWSSNITPLYTAPPKAAEWVGLTAYEIQEIHLKNPHWGNFACAIEAKLKEKNHG